MLKPKKNDIFRVEIGQVADNAMGVARIDGYVVFVKGALANEECLIRILKAGSSFGYGKIERILTPSPERIVSDCPYFPVCGGCDLRHMTYEEELRTKLRWASDALSRIGGCTVLPQEITGAYDHMKRNKAIYAVGGHGGEPVAGFYRGRSHDIVSTERCLLQYEHCDEAARAVVQWMNNRQIAGGKNGIRHVFARTAVSTGQTQVCLVAALRDLSGLDELVKSLRESIPSLAGILLNVNSKPGNSVFGEEFFTLWGSEELEDTLCSLRFRVSPASFYQVNPRQAEALYTIAAEYANLTKNEKVLDLYCGIGTISLFMAGKALEVVGIEEVPAAVRNAEKNAEINGISNARFFCCDAGNSAELLRCLDFVPDAVIVDPPRKGLEHGAIQLLKDLVPPRIVYISCNPATLARDIRSLREAGYECIRSTCVDMFPRTAHVECVVLMSRVDK